MKNIVIGGTHGLGQEIAQNLQSSGEETFAVGRSYNEPEHGEGLRVDLAKIEEAKELANKVAELGASAINFYWVAGYGYAGNFAEQRSPEDMAAANFGNVLPIAQRAFQSMATHEESSSFVVVSSTSGYKARANQAVYAGTKHAQVGFARSLGQEAERLQSSVKVALFMPSGIQTPFWDKIDVPANVYDEFLDPRKLATHMLNAVRKQDSTFYEEAIERGSKL